MADATAVKKKGRSKKVVEAGDAEPVVEEITAKKGRTRKSPAKESNASTSESVPLHEAVTAKSTATKKSASSKAAAKTSTSTSKRTAKTSKDDVDRDLNASSITSSILEEATAFRKMKGSVSKEVPGPSPKSIKTKPQLKQVGSIKVAPANQSIATATTNPASHIKPSPFLSSFLNDPEPAPVPPPQKHQVANPEESRADLQQATVHAFEDSILTSTGKVKGSSSSEKSTTSAIEPSTMPVAAAATTSQLRAFTTSSFAALRASSKPSTPKTTAAATSKPIKAGPAKAPKAPTVPLSTPAPPPATASSSTATSRPPPLQPPPPNPPTNPSTTFATTPSTPPDPNLKRTPTYRSLNWRWFRLIVGVPFLIWTSYELWQRWERGELGGRDAITGGRRERELRAYQESLRRKAEGELGVGGGGEDGGAVGRVAAVEVGGSSGLDGEKSWTGIGIGIANKEAAPGNPASTLAPNTTATANAVIDLPPAPWQSAYPTAREGFARPGDGFRF